MDRKASDYWNQVDLYIGGTEHAVGHLLYSRLWTKILFDLGHIGYDEPFKKLLNQGMITGVSQMIFRYGQGSSNHFPVKFVGLNPINLGNKFYDFYLSEDFC